MTSIDSNDKIFELKFFLSFRMLSSRSFSNTIHCNGRETKTRIPNFKIVAFINDKNAEFFGFGVFLVISNVVVETLTSKSFFDVVIASGGEQREDSEFLGRGLHKFK